MSKNKKDFWSNKSTRKSKSNSNKKTTFELQNVASKDGVPNFPLENFATKFDRLVNSGTKNSQIGLPPLVKKSRPLENATSRVTSLPSILKKQVSTTEQESSKSLTSSFDMSDKVVDVETLVKFRVPKMRNNEFIYLSYAYPHSDVRFSYFSLIEVPYSIIDKTGFYTLSREGLTFWGLTENHFTKLDDWYNEYKKYCMLKKIKAFKYFRLWKGFKVWQKTIQWKKIDDAKNFLEKNLFTANPSLAKALLSIQEECCKLGELKFCNFPETENWHIFYFYEVQMTQLEHTKDLLLEFRNRMRDISYLACYEAMKLKGFSDEMIKDDIAHATRKMKDQITFADRSNKKIQCARLTVFLGLCDFLIINLLYNITKNTFIDMSQAFQLHSCLGPSIETIENITDINRQLEDLREEGAPQSPLFIATLVLETNTIEINPSRSVSIKLIEDVVQLIMEAIQEVKSFQSDPQFLIFTQPSIMGHKEDKLYKNPPKVDFLLEVDESFEINKKFILEHMNVAYRKIEIYMKRFDQIRESYREDMMTDKEALRSESNLDKLITYCKRYTSEINGLDDLLPSCNLGLFQLNQDTFKEKIIPKCKELLSILEQLLPRLAKETVREVKIKAEKVMTKLTTHPDDTKKFVQYIDYLEKKCPEILKQIEKTLEYALIALQIMKEYEISVDEEDKDNYFEMEEFSRKLNEVWKSKCDSRAAIVAEFAESLQNDIKMVFREINDVFEEVKKTWMLESSSKFPQVSEVLAELMERLSRCQDDSQVYTEYQKEFNLEETKFDILNTVLEEVKFRQLLWDSFQGWRDGVATWNETSFHKLDVTQIIEMNTKTIKNCIYLEKNLPKNDIIPKLKAEAEEFKEKIPTLQCLRSADLKPRHWLKIELLLDRRLLGVEGLTLYTFEDANAFDQTLSTAILEVFYQAKSEAHLEENLKKVENTWKVQELSLLSHRDARDMFVLTGIDELQAVYDDSYISISNIAASRHIGSLKPKVDDWVKNLDLFGKVLDEWLICQKKWIYLEAVFSGTIIQQTLPHEFKIFKIADKWYRNLMRDVSKAPLTFPIMTNAQHLENFKQNIILMEQVSRCLEMFLETKRVAFPRFYFLSNNELFEIFVHVRNPHLVQPYLSKCFDGILKIEFGTRRDEKKEVVPTNDILAMYSPEGERVQFVKGVKARGAIEDWLTKVEEIMKLSVKSCIKFAYQCYSSIDRTIWFREHPAQAVLAISQQQWAADIHGVFDRNDGSESPLQLLTELKDKLTKNLTALASISRSKIPALIRKVLCSLIIVDTYAKDTTSNLIEKEVSSSEDFEWQKILRYFWREDIEAMMVKMAKSSFPYHHEYLGVSKVLVMTPATDRYYLSLTNAISMNLGGALSGPSSSGKTETIKMFANTIGMRCIVLNCSEKLDYKNLGKFLSGLAQSGAYGCFDEFNRIKPEVMSVIAQQLITIRNAQLFQMRRFVFEGRETKLNKYSATFITMAVGYNGRYQLPDNLKALFRPISIMAPDSLLIATVLLHTEGFQNSKLLAQKCVYLNKLCSNQCRKQNFYDFGLRALKTVVYKAGDLRRIKPDQPEEMTLMRALRDVYVPQFHHEDLSLFEGILGDLFPGIDVQENHLIKLQSAIENCLINKKLIPIQTLVNKQIQLFETMSVRLGVILLGESGCGKSTIYKTLADSLAFLEVQDSIYKQVKIQYVIPKSVSLNELYGSLDPLKMEWNDGLLSNAIKNAASSTNDKIDQWIILDGKIDSQWIENLNSVLDDTKMLTLPNSERIKVPDSMNMIFEVDDLSDASPAAISRCGIVFVNPTDLRWNDIVSSWLQSFDENQLNNDLKDFLNLTFAKYFEELLSFSQDSCECLIEQFEISKVKMLCVILSDFIKKFPSINTLEITEAKRLLLKTWIWASLWSVGCNLTEIGRELLENHLRKYFQQNDYGNLSTDNLWDLYIDYDSRNFENWEKIIPKFEYARNAKFFDLHIPNLNTVRFGYIARLLMHNEHPVMLTGPAGVGKSLIARETLEHLSKSNVIPVWMNFSPKTSSSGTQTMIEGKLEKRKSTLFGAPIGKKIVIFVDDVNLPTMDAFKSQAPVELLRQFLDYKGFYNRKHEFLWRDIVDVSLSAACNSSGKRLNKRFVRHFALLAVPSPDDQIMNIVVGSIIEGFFSNFVKSIASLTEPMTSATISIYQKVLLNFLPTPKKSHYMFNFRDLLKCIQGILQASPSCYNTASQMLRLFYHEALRVYYDRLIDNQDKNHFKDLMKEVCMKYFESEIVGDDEILLYGDFMQLGQSREDRTYEEIKEFDKLKEILNDYMEDYNSISGNNAKIIFFQDAVEHCLKIARILRSERGNALLVGTSGLGKQSLARLASHINGYQTMQIDINRHYTHSIFRDDLRKCYWNSGIQNFPTVFLIDDSQILHDEFLEDLNSILNSGELINLFEEDEYEKVILNSQSAMVESGTFKDQNRDQIYDYFISRVKSNLHIVICMSPGLLRQRCQTFPSLLNCCTINWFLKWPAEALYHVALENLDMITENDELSKSLARLCAMIHESVESVSVEMQYETGRYYCTTPSSFLELINQYNTLLRKKTENLTFEKDRISNGLSKLLNTNETITVMGEDLKKFVPIIEQKTNSLKELTSRLEKDSAQAELVKKAVSEQEAEGKTKAVLTQELADDAAKDLEIVMPTLRAALDALRLLNKNDFNEIKVFQKPPKLVQAVMEAICILMNSKPDWNTAKQIMSDVNFLKKLQEYDVNHIPEATLKKIKPYVETKDFQPAIVEKVSKVARTMCLWVIAVDKYAKVYKAIEPKIKKRDTMEYELRECMVTLKRKQNELAEVEAKIQKLKESLDEKQLELHEIQAKFDLTNVRLNRAIRLQSALGEDESRWRELVDNLEEQLWAVPGDVLVASTYIAYLGAFPLHYRNRLAQAWNEQCRLENIPCSSDFDFIRCLGDQFKIRQWTILELPNDGISVENAIIVTQTGRWPLIIDPQDQANKWIRKLEEENELIVVQQTDSHCIRTIEMAIIRGKPILLEELGETLERSLHTIISRSIYSQAGRLMLRFGDRDIDYNPNFKLYMTTKLSNPKYLPEIYIQVNLVNFSITKFGLEDQLLSFITSIEIPDTKKQQTALILSIHQDKQQLQFLEEKILKLLFYSEGNILDNEELVEILTESKELSSEIAMRLIDAEKLDQTNEEEQERYRGLAKNGATMFFVLIDLAKIDRLYQFSLSNFIKVFCEVLRKDHPKMEVDERIRYLKKEQIYAVYCNTLRGIFEKHKLVFTFLLATATEEVEASYMEFLLNDSIILNEEKANQLSFLTDFQWSRCLYLQEKFPAFENLLNELEKRIEITFNDFIVQLTNSDTKSNINWDFKLSPFEKLMLVSVIQPTLFIKAIGAYVEQILGKEFTENKPQESLSTIYSDISKNIPLILILSPGSNPLSSLQKLAKEFGFADQLLSISLGQDQGEMAERIIGKARKLGQWIFLQNCHLSGSWMKRLEVIVRDICNSATTNENFRLFLSMNPSECLPISMLQKSVKIISEFPRGLRGNLLKSLNDLNEDHFEFHILRNSWRSVVFGMCMFHSVVLERKKFGAIGWNCNYEFTEEDLKTTLQAFESFIDREDDGKIPWNAINCLVTEIFYGGKVTDFWDHRSLRAILDRFSSAKILEENYKYSESDLYLCPDSKKLSDFKNYASTLPYYDQTEIFGLHENANIFFDMNEKNFFLSTISNLYSVEKESDGEENDECLEMILNIRNSLPGRINVERVHPDFKKTDERGRQLSMTIVLFQEIENFDILMSTIHKSLNDLENAVKGLSAITEELEETFQSLLRNQIPQMWKRKSYLSVKMLGSWLNDLNVRIEYIQDWTNNGLPKSIWIGGLFNPQSFLTGVLQIYSRKYNLPIDFLQFEFQVMDKILIQERIYESRLNETSDCEYFDGLDEPDDGAFIHGIFIESGRWDESQGGLCDASIGELTSILPVVWLKPTLTLERAGRYEAPLYKTPQRVGCRNFILSVLLNTRKPSDFWILRSTALVLMTAD